MGMSRYSDMHNQKIIKVLIIDDSAVMRQVLTSVLQHDLDIQVVGTAPNPIIAREKIKSLKPDVLTLDVEMPGMDGITFLEKLMRLRPMPVVMVSSHTEKGATATLRALELGAVDFVTKPYGGIRQGMTLELMEEIRAKVRAAANAHLRTEAKMPAVKPILPQMFSSMQECRNGIIVIGASAGGTQAITEVLAKLPRSTPGIAIVQHMPPKFTASFAERLHNQCDLDVSEAKSGDRLKPGVALIAPGGYHMSITRAAGGYAVRVYLDEPVKRHRPSVDVLFESAASAAGKNAMGILLTGMGSDGAMGLHAMKLAGANTIAQDEKSCVVFGMPEQAIRLGAVGQVVSLDRIADAINIWSRPESNSDKIPQQDISG